MKSISILAVTGLLLLTGCSSGVESAVSESSAVSQERPTTSEPTAEPTPVPDTSEYLYTAGDEAVKGGMGITFDLVSFDGQVATFELRVTNYADTLNFGQHVGVEQFVTDADAEPPVVDPPENFPIHDRIEKTEIGESNSVQMRFEIKGQPEGYMVELYATALSDDNLYFAGKF